MTKLFLVLATVLSFFNPKKILKKKTNSFEDEHSSISAELLRRSVMKVKQSCVKTMDEKPYEKGFK